MKNVKFEVNFSKKGGFTQNGYDNIEFLISPNPGEALKPLAKIASGGETSRIMLALKDLLAEADGIETFVFDEIDAGVSGRTAQSVAEKLFSASKARQILCVSHLPQIAAMADTHYLIEKKLEGGKTFTIVEKLARDSIIPEIARLISGAKITETSLKTAEEMKQMADEIKAG